MNTENIDKLLKALDDKFILKSDEVDQYFDGYGDGDVALYEAISLGLVSIDQDSPNEPRGFVMTEKGHLALQGYENVRDYLTHKIRLEKVQLSNAEKLNKTYWITFWIGIGAFIVTVSKIIYDIAKIPEQKAMQKELLQLQQSVDSIENAFRLHLEHGQKPFFLHLEDSLNTSNNYIPLETSKKDSTSLK